MFGLPMKIQSKGTLQWILTLQYKYPKLFKRHISLSLCWSDSRLCTEGWGLELNRRYQVGHHLL